MSQNLLEAAGGRAQKETKFVSLFTSRFMSGYYTNRSLLRSPMQALYSDFYKMGACDSLCDGLNTEISGRLTLVRRPGNVRFCSQETAAGVDNFYSFNHNDGTIQVIADTSLDVEVVTPSSITSIFTKTTGAAEAFVQGVNDFLYIADGVDTVMYAPDVANLNPNTGKQTWNMGGVAPTLAPVLTVIPTASIGLAWVATTMFTTMGLIYDGVSVHQLVSVNATGTNTTPLGTTASGEPDFSGAVGSTVTESSGTPISWTNVGPVDIWRPLKVYGNINNPGGLSSSIPCVIYDPVSDSMYTVDNPGNAGGTSGSVKPAFTGVVGSYVHEPAGNIKWYCFANGSTKYPVKWAPGVTYPQRAGADYADACVVTPTTIAAANLGAATATPLFIWEADNAGTSGTSYVPHWATVAGDTTLDGDCIWNCLGSGTWAMNTTYSAWSNTTNVFSVIVDPNNNFQVALSVTGPSGATIPATWATTYGSTTQDGVNPGLATFVGVTWVCVGPKTLWVKSTQWYLPSGGFIPPSPSQPYGGAVVQDNNTPINNQYVIASGLSGSTAPSPWGTIGTDTTDGTVTWHAASRYSAVSFTWTKNYGYVYCYYSRTANDYYNTNPPPLQIPNTNSPNITGALGAPTGGETGSVTNASPLATIPMAGANEQIIITMQGSLDPQFDTILLFRSADGFAVSGPYLFCSAFPMPARNGGQPGTLAVTDFMPDLPTAGLPGLDPLETAPIDGQNAPPPGSYGSDQFQPLSPAYSTQPAAGTAITGLVYYLGRLWGFIGNSVFASGGPDTNPGNGFTAWPAINEFPFDSQIIRLLPTSSCLLVFTTTNIYLLGGGPAISDFYSQLLAPGVGILSWNAVTMVLGLPYIFTSDRQFVNVDPSGGYTRIGHPIGDKLSLYDPSEVYVTWHSYGDQEHALFVSNGASEWYRCDPNPTPDSQLTGPVWSPRATIVGLYNAIQSIETEPGVKKLLIGPATAGYILARDSTMSTFQDDGHSYKSYGTMGNIVLAHPGQMAELSFVECDFVKIGSQPSVYVLIDELAQTTAVGFEEISGTFVSDPPKLYGPTATPETLWMNRYYFGQNITTNTDTEGQPLGPFIQAAVGKSTSASNLSLSVVAQTTNMWALFAFASTGQLANFGPAGWTHIAYGSPQFGQGIFSQMVETVSAPTIILPTGSEPVAGVVGLFQTNGSTPQVVQSVSTSTFFEQNNGDNTMQAILPSTPAPGNALIAVVLCNDILTAGSTGIMGVWDTYGNYWYQIGVANNLTTGTCFATLWYCGIPNPLTKNIQFLHAGHVPPFTYVPFPTMDQVEFWVFEISNLIAPTQPAAVDVVSIASSPAGPPFPPNGGFHGNTELTINAQPSANAAEWAVFVASAGEQYATLPLPSGFTNIYTFNSGSAGYKNLSSTQEVIVDEAVSYSGGPTNWAAVMVLFGNHPTVVQQTVFSTNDYAGFSDLTGTVAGNSILIFVYGYNVSDSGNISPAVFFSDSQTNVYQLIGASYNPNRDVYNGYGTSFAAVFATQNIPGGNVTVVPLAFFDNYGNVASANFPGYTVIAMEVSPFTLIPGESAYQPVPSWCKFLQLKVDFGNTDAVQNELLAFSIFGALWQEK